MVNDGSTSSVPPLSQSKQGLLACPYSYTVQVIDGKRGESSEASRRGTLIHIFLKNYVDHLVRAGKKQDLQAFDILREGMQPDAWDILEGLRKDFKIEPDDVFATEHKILISWDFKAAISGPAPFSSEIMAGAAYEMTLDLITIDESGTRATIDDYKSNFRAYEADTFQVQLYSLGLFLLNPQIEEITFRLWFVRWNREKTAKFTRADIPELQAIAEKWRALQMFVHIGLEQPPAHPGSHCIYCPLLAAGCPLESNPYDDPESELRKVIYFRQALKKAELAVRDHADKTGPILATDAIGTQYSAEWALSDEKHVSLDALPAILDWEKRKKDPILYKLRISGLSAILKAKKRAPLADELANYTEILTKSKFRVGKVKEMEEEDLTDAE
jgi:hypothetical protein